MSNTIDIAGMSEQDVTKKLTDFSELLQNIDSLDEKKRALWKNIYENAIRDRQNSYVIFCQLFNLVATKSTEYAVHGRTLTACIERMSKSNDQLIKLAELIAKAQSGDDAINVDDMFNKIQSG